MPSLIVGRLGGAARRGTVPIPQHASVTKTHAYCTSDNLLLCELRRQTHAYVGQPVVGIVKAAIGSLDGAMEEGVSLERFLVPCSHCSGSGVHFEYSNSRNPKF